MASSWGSSWGTSWGTSWGGGAPVATAKDSGAGVGQKWKVVPLDEWLKLHHPDIEEKIEEIEAVEEAVETATKAEAKTVVASIKREIVRLEAASIDGALDRIEAAAQTARYRRALESALLSAQNRVLELSRKIRDADDEETMLTIIYHA